MTNIESRAGSAILRQSVVPKGMRATKARVFIAWSEETKDAAKAIRDRLDNEHLSPWLSDQIEWGVPFKRKIREAIIGADLVIAVFPKDPSRWQIAEAGLAYFEQKLLPIMVDTGQEQIDVVEPFNELQVHKLARRDIDQGAGDTIDALVDSVKEKLGEGSSTNRLIRTFRFANRLFYLGVPVVGALIVCSLLIAAFVPSGEDHFQFYLWKAGHTVFGAIVYGGGAFIALVFARAGTSASFSERQFGFQIGRELFLMWVLVAIVQFFVGIFLLRESSYSINDYWVSIAMFSYLFAIMFWFGAYDRYRSSNEADREDKPFRVWITQSFVGNVFSGVAILLLTLVIVFMSVKPQVIQ